MRAWADKNNIPVSKYILTIGSLCIFSMFCRWRILKLLDRRLARLQQRYNLKLKNWIYSYVSTQPTLQRLQALQSFSELLRQIILASSWNLLHSLSWQAYRTACKLLASSWKVLQTKPTKNKPLILIICWEIFWDLNALKFCIVCIIIVFSFNLHCRVMNKQPTSIAKQKVVQMMSTRLHLYVLLLCMSEFKVFMHNAMHNVFQIRGYSKDLLNSWTPEVVGAI